MLVAMEQTSTTQNVGEKAMPSSFAEQSGIYVGPGTDASLILGCPLPRQKYVLTCPCLDTSS